MGCSSSEPPPPPDLPVGTEVGYRAPPIPGVLADGVPFVLDLADASPKVLIFYRSAQCGLCRVQLEQAQSQLDAYRYEGARVIGITLDTPELSRTAFAANGITFDLVSVDRSIFERWGAIAPYDAAPMPATYIIDGNGVVRFRHVGRNASDRTSDAGVLTVLERLREE